MKVLGLFNGEIINMNDNVVSLEDRGYQFGDGAYEVIRVYNAKCFAMEEHFQRLERSLRELRITMPYSFDELRQFHYQLIKESGITEAGIYTQITRGIAPRAHNFPAETIKPVLSMSIRPVIDNRNKLKNGAKVSLVPDMRWMRCDIKSINLLGNILAKQQAKENGSYEAVMHRRDIITEGSSSNFFVVKQGKIWTHPANNLLIKGITRTILLEKVIPVLGLAVCEKAFDKDFLSEADEAFLTGTTTEILPVIDIEGKKVGCGNVGEITRKLQGEFNKLINKECGR